MLSALNNINKKVYAFDVSKSNGPFYCPHCKEEVVLKKGEIKEAHFSHKTNSHCYTTNESEEHKHIKISIYQALSKYYFIKNLEMEKYLGNCISDVYFEKNDKKFAIEIQLSHLDRKTISERTEKYKQKGIHVLWVHSYNRFLERIDLYSKTFKIKDWEKWLVAMNYGNLYLWKKEDIIIPVKVSKFTKNGKLLKSTKRIASEKPSSIAKNFYPIEKEEWNNFPSAKLLYFNKNN